MRRKLGLFLLLVLATSSCAWPGGDQALDDWIAATSCDDREAFSLALDRINPTVLAQAGELSEVDCSGSVEGASIVVARSGEPLMELLDGYGTISFCDGEATLGFSSGSAGSSEVPHRLVSQLEQGDFC